MDASVLVRRVVPRALIVGGLTILALLGISGALPTVGAQEPEICVQDLDFAADQTLIPCPDEPERESKPKYEIPECDGGKEPYRWNPIAESWERDFCKWLYDEVPTHDPFDAVFGFNPDAFHWNYGEAIQYLLDQGFSQSQLSTFEGQVEALVQLGLWDPETKSIPEDADLSFLANPPDDPGFLPWLPTR